MLRLQVTRQQVGKGGVPYIATHDGRTIRYPDPDIRVCLLLLPLLCFAMQQAAPQAAGDSRACLTTVLVTVAL